MKEDIRTRLTGSQVSVKAALIATFTGLSLGTNYTLTALPNVKLMDTFNFIATYLFGLSVGIPTIVLTRTIYASVNPWGPASGGLVPVLVAGDCFYGLAGYLAKRFTLFDREYERIDRNLTLGLFGLFSALGFDLWTNFQQGLISVSGPNFQTYLWRAFIFGFVTMNFPLPLGIIHEVSDFFFFSTVAPSALSLIKRSGIFYGGPLAVKSE